MTKRTNYFIEIRYFGKAKHRIKSLINEVGNKFRLKKGHKVPHITLIQPFTTKRQKWLVSDFKKVCSNYKSMKFTVDGIGTFPFFVVFAKVKPGDELLKFRKELLKTIKSYCCIKNINRPFKPHTTIALRMGLFRFLRIWLYMKLKPRLIFTNHVMRATLLKGKIILYEYDFLHKRLLNRSQAKSKKGFSKAFTKLKKHKKKTK
ncbi:hypothetical protein CMO89_01700 [Candidatus Woesearchaeota archaeon]|nr:hypothetical protein [Candidatus Woesearchaeota archaeon]|tara:strand:- start:10360 stop:10971 length:612 start_codon:yes stop_codon:yes gene_type:complete